MRPLDGVIPQAGPYKGTGGVVQKVELDDAGKVTRAHVEMDVDKKIVPFKPADLKLIR